MTMGVTTPKTLDQLRTLVAGVIKSDPHKRDGFDWAARPQAFYCDELGVSVETLRRFIKRLPFVRQREMIDGKVVTLLREGKAGPKTPKHVQNILVSIWRKKTGRDISPKEYGRFAGLVQHWGLEHAPAILTTVLNNWPGFMTGVKLDIAENGGIERFYKYPSTSVILRFHYVGLELHVMEHQETKGVAATDEAGLKYGSGMTECIMSPID